MVRETEKICTRKRAQQLYELKKALFLLGS